ncbi:MAG: glycosyltransferase [Pantoea sp.]|uniref:glycosyltransferase n=1 Tax=Pantoea sp. TaxID=69393 RepID=UPI0023A4D4D2|nr:glycosyltransferase [Pantoea sp.]MDE1185914.1 glycosyltransferase [Pantoea sp.]
MHDANHKKILFVSETLHGHGGMENVTRQVINLINSDNAFSAGLFLLDSRLEIASESWLDGLVWGQSSSVTRNPKIARFVHILRLARFIRQHKPDVVIALNTIPCMLARKALNLSGCKATLYSWMHLPPKNRYRPHYLLMADAHLAISAEIKSQLIELGAKPDNIHVVFNPVKAVPLVIARPAHTRFLYVGRVHFEDQKQLKDLFDALQQVQGNWTLDIVGDGYDRERCEDYAQQLGIADNLQWHGWQPNAWKYIETHIKEVTALVLTSNHEGFPLILLEAMARGIFCVSSDCVSGPSEIIYPDVNGLLYPVNQVGQLAEILQGIADGRVLPDAQEIKQSLAVFYEANYMERLERIIVQDTYIE